MGTVGKALDLLDLFTQRQTLMGLSQIARAAGMNKATCHRLLNEMVSRGMVEQVGAAREYRLGPAVLRLAALRECAVPTRDAAMPVLRALAAATGETAHLSHLVAGRLTTLAFACSTRHGIKVTMEDADFLPFHLTASGAAVVAFLPPDVAAAILAASPAPEALRARADACRRLGWAETVSTFETDVQGLAVPLFDAGAACTGALAVAAALPRMTPALHATITAELIRAGAALTTLRGGTLPAGLASLWRDAGAKESP